MVEPLSTRQAIDGLIAAWNANDALRASAFFATDGEYSEAGREPIRGRDAIAEHFTRFFRDGPPWRFEVDEVIVEGERAALTYRFFLRSPGGAWIERSGCAVVTVQDLLFRRWREFQG